MLQCIRFLYCLSIFSVLLQCIRSMYWWSNFPVLLQCIRCVYCWSIFPVLLQCVRCMYCRSIFTIFCLHRLPYQLCQRHSKLRGLCQSVNFSNTLMPDFCQIKIDGLLKIRNRFVIEKMFLSLGPRRQWSKRINQPGTCIRSRCNTKNIVKVIPSIPRAERATKPIKCQ